MPDLFISDKNNIKEVDAGITKDDKKPTVILSEEKGSEKKQETREGPTLKNEHPDFPRTLSPLGSFNYYPHHVNFENKDPEEKVVLFLRRHPITNVGWICLTFILVITPSFLTALPLFDAVPFKFILLGIFFWYLFTFVYAFEAFLDWFFSVNIITDERIFDFDFFNLTYRKVTDVNTDRIQDVTVSVGGGMGTLFNYGNVLIQTAAEIPEIDFLDVPQPDKVAKILREMRLEEEVEQMEGRVR